MASTSLTWTPSSAGSQQKTTLSMWLKKSKPDNAGYIFEVSDGSNQFVIRESNAQIKFWHFAGSSYDWEAEISPLLRDVHGWYHFVMSIDTTQSTLANRLKCWLNGVSQTVTFTSGSSNLSQNSNWIFNKNSTHRWGRADNSYWDGLMTHIHQTDGYCYDASTFGTTDATTGQWTINAVPTIANYGTNGYFILKNGNSVTDQSPNSNNFAVATGTLTKSEDNPSSVFATLNPLNTNDADQTFTNGNTKQAVSGNWLGISATIAINSGKYYWEVKNSSGGNFGAGIGKEGVTGTSLKYFSTNNNWLYDQSTNYGYYKNGSNYYKGNNNTTTTYGADVGSNDILMVAWDHDNGKIFLGKNGTWFDSSNPANGTNPAYTITTGDDYWYPIFEAENSNIEVNFGNGYFGTSAVSSAGTNASNLGIFEYDVPSGFTALCTKGLNE